MKDWLSAAQLAFSPHFSVHPIKCSIHYHLHAHLFNIPLSTGVTALLVVYLVRRYIFQAFLLLMVFVISFPANWVFLTYEGGQDYNKVCNGVERSAGIMIICNPNLISVSKVIFMWIHHSNFK